MSRICVTSDDFRYRPREYAIDDGPVDPITGAAGALMGTATQIMMGVADMPIQTLKLLNIHPDARANKKGKSKASGDDATYIGESADNGRPTAGRSATGTSNVSANSSSSNFPSRQSSDEKNAAGSPDAPGTPSHRSTFMSQAFAESAGRSRSPSRDRVRSLAPHACEVVDRLGHNQRGSSTSGADSATKDGTTSPKAGKNKPDINESMDSAIDTGKGLARIVGAGFRSPMDFSLGVAKGLHNVPKLYGAEVRQVDKVTDLQSGLRTAAKVR